MKKIIDYENPWIYEDKPFTSEDIGDYIGFVYLLTDPKGKKYVGKKLFVSKRKLPPLKGKTRRRTKISESDWKNYYGSQSDIKQLLLEGKKDEFERTILKCVETKKQLTYFEIKYQMLYEVLEKPDEFFNDNILGKFFTKDLADLDFESLVGDAI